MFLQIMADAGDIGGYFRTVGKPDPGHLTQRRIGLFGGNGHNPGTNPPFLRTRLKRRRLRFNGYLLPAKTNQLINRRHLQKTPFRIAAGNRGVNYLLKAPFPKNII
jgi:hypothetical protein